jgi:predicted tellurium resistance membrane protein TerC
MEVFLNPDAWIALLTLTFLEIVLRIDNIIFLFQQRVNYQKVAKKATKIGMFLAMFMRIALLFGINLIDSNERTWTIDLRWRKPELRDKVSYCFRRFIPYL